jgi:hypothetical protein
MEMGYFDAKAGPDRFSTSDEIRAALCSVRGLFMECEKEGPWEVASDQGGHVLIETEEGEILTLVEKLDTTAN